MRTAPKLLSLSILIGIAMASTTIAQNTLPPTGNVGVGTNNPQTALHIKASGGSHTCAAQLRLELQIGGFTNGCGPASSIWDISSFGGNTLAFTAPSIGNPVLTLTGKGNVGINIGNPTAALDIVGKVKIADGTQGADRVLTSDSDGRASWQDLPGAGIGGAGVPNSLAKFTGATTIAPSLIFDDGTHVFVSTFSGGPISPRMVVANQDGRLSAQAFPPPSAGDNLGNHTALTDLNMTAHNIHGVSDFVGFVNGAEIRTVSGDLMTNRGLGIGLPPDILYPFKVNGSAFAVAGVWAPSDRRYKKEVRELDRPLDIVMQLEGIQYEFDKAAFPSLRFDDGTNIGFVAQDVARVLPEAVRQDSEGFYAINYSAVVPVLVEAVKAQQATIEHQSKRIEELEKGIVELRTFLSRRERSH
jgi:hypothetical protein